MPRKERGNSPCRCRERLWAISAIAVLVMIGIAVVAWRSKKDPLDRVFAYAPPNAVAVFHTDSDQTLDALEQWVRKYKDDLPEDFNGEKFLEPWRAVESWDGFLMTSTDLNVPVAFLVVVRTDLTVEELHRGLTVLLAEGGPPPELHKGVNGRYRLTGTALTPGDMTAIDGREADNIEAGVVLLGPTDLLTQDFVADLGKGGKQVDRLRALAGEADTAAPCWLAMRAKQTPPLDGLSHPIPETVVGHFWPGGQRTGRLTMVFPDGVLEGTLAAGEVEAPLDLGDELAITLEGNVLTVNIEEGVSLFQLCYRALGNAREEAKRCSSRMNLRMLAAAMESYAEENSGRLPDGFHALAEFGVEDSVLTSPCDNRPGIDYIAVSFRRMDRIPRPKETILIYERPEIHDGEGTNVVFAEGGAKWVDMDEFARLLDQSRAAARAQR